MIPLTVAAASSSAVKSSRSVRTTGGFGVKPDRDPARDAHRALAAHEAAPQVVAGLSGSAPPSRATDAVAEHGVDREDVRRGDARGEAVRTAGVGADVAADRAGLLRRRVGRVVQAEVRDRPRQVEVEHARLDPRDPLDRVDLEHAVHLGRHDDDGVVERGRPAGEPGAAPPRDERHVVALARSRTAAAISSVERGKHTALVLPRSTPGVACVERELERLGPRAVGTERGAQIVEQRVTSDGRSLPTLLTSGRCARSPTRPCDRQDARYAPRMAKGPTREWVSFDDPREDGRIWQIDVTFLLSSWDCIFGAGCQGVYTEPAPELVQGCCSYGAHFSDRADREHVERLAPQVPDDLWQFAKIGKKQGIAAKVGQARRQDRLAHPAGRRRLHLPQPSGLGERTRVRAAPVGHAHRHPPQRAQAGDLLAAPAAAGRRAPGRRHRDLAALGVRPRRLGRGR